MRGYNYRFYDPVELEGLMKKAKKERDNYLASVSENGSSFSRIKVEEIEKRILGIADALNFYNPHKYPKSRDNTIMLGFGLGGVD